MGLVAEGVAGLGGRGAVVAPAVGLDDEAEVGPEEVDLVVVDHLFGEWRWEGRPAAAIGRNRTSSSVSERRKVWRSSRVRSGFTPRSSGVVVERGAERLGVDHVVLVRLVHHPLEAVRRQFGRPVDQGPDRRRDRDAVALGDVTLQQARSVTWPLSPVARDLQRRRTVTSTGPVALGANPPKRSGAPVAQHRTLAADENRRHPALLAVRQRPSHGVDATSHRPETAGGEAMLDRRRS